MIEEIIAISIFMPILTVLILREVTTIWVRAHRAKLMANHKPSQDELKDMLSVIKMVEGQIKSKVKSEDDSDEIDDDHYSYQMMYN